MLNLPCCIGAGGYQETYEVHKGTINGSSTALAADAQDVTRAWIPDMALRRMDVILVGPQRRVVQVTDLVPLKGGFEIYGTDRHGNRVYIPANSSQRDHQFVMAAGERIGTFDGDCKVLYLSLLVLPSGLPLDHAKPVNEPFRTASIW